MRLAHEHERLYGDTAGMSLPNRWGAYDALLGGRRRASEARARQRLADSGLPASLATRVAELPCARGRAEPVAARRADQAGSGLRRRVLATGRPGSAAGGKGGPLGPFAAPRHWNFSAISCRMRPSLCRVPPVLRPVTAMSAPSETPLMQQYREIKARHQDAILLFRMGDFYEMFYRGRRGRRRVRSG